VKINRAVTSGEKIGKRNHSTPINTLTFGIFRIQKPRFGGAFFQSRGFGGEIGLSDSLGYTLSHELVQILYLTPNQCQ